MRILYIARHNQSNSADDEGAISYALEALGHSVYCAKEDEPLWVNSSTFDLVIFHKWSDAAAIASIQCPKVFWYFDLVDYPDPHLMARCRQRRQWMERVTPLVDLGFCTDGEWVKRDTTGKLVWLMQGADERVVGRGRPPTKHPPILFTGIALGGGTGRISFVQEMDAFYGRKFQQIRYGVYGRHLANRIAGSEMVVCPDSPLADHYWSNRVYNALGFGAFVLHPHASGLRSHYTSEHLVYYHDRAELHRLIKHYSQMPELRHRISEAGLQHTKEHHLYRHRVDILLRTIKERGVVR